MRAVRSSSIVPGLPDDVVFLVLDDFAPIGQAYRGAESGEADEDAIIRNLLSGLYARPQRVVAFSLMEDWARDVTTSVAFKVLKRALAQGWTLPDSTRRLVERVTDADVPAAVREQAGS